MMNLVSLVALASVVVTATQATIVEQNNSRILVLGGKDAQIDGAVAETYEVLKWNDTTNEYDNECNAPLPLPVKSDKASDTFAFYTGGAPYVCYKGGKFCYKIKPDFTFEEVDNPQKADGTYECSPNPKTTSGAKLVYTGSNLVGLSDSKVLLVGADPNKAYFDQFGVNTVNTTCQFDSATGKWSKGPELPYKSYFQCVVRAEWNAYGEFYLMTGINEEGINNDTYQDNSVTQAWKWNGTQFNAIDDYTFEARQAMCPMLGDGDIVGYGGQIDSDSFQTAASKYNTASSQWGNTNQNLWNTNEADIKDGWSAALQVHYEDAFILVGGTNNDGSNNKVLGGNLYQVGDITGNELQFTKVGSLNTPRKLAAAVAVPDTYWNLAINATICNPTGA